jgi:uncharacterized LabA/DUF88 family protein
MAQDNISMALFCDFENVALGVRDANYDKFDIKRVLERLLLKGSIVVKKAYCDWERYKGFKAAMHEANFELIEIPHVRQSGKNSADIRLVVDALDLCYTKSHVNTFVIISGDSDFSPLVSKLRENAKHVIGVGVKQSTSDLLIANCDEFIFYDDLVRESQRQAARRSGGQGQAGRDTAPQARRSPEEERRRREEMDMRRLKAVEMAAETYEALVTDRDDGGRIWASVLKEAIKRRNPGFSESYFGFRTFGNLLEEAQSRGMLEFGRDEKSSTWVARGTGVPSTGALVRVDGGASLTDAAAKHEHAQPRMDAEPDDEGYLSGAVFTSVTVAPAAGGMPRLDAVAASEPDGAHDAAHEAADAATDPGSRRRSRGGRGRSRSGREASGRQADIAVSSAADIPRATPAPAPTQASVAAAAPAPATTPAPARKAATPSRKRAARPADNNNDITNAKPPAEKKAASRSAKPRSKAAAKDVG